MSIGCKFVGEFQVYWDGDAHLKMGRGVGVCVDSMSIELIGLKKMISSSASVSSLLADLDQCRQKTCWKFEANNL